MQPPEGTGGPESTSILCMGNILEREATQKAQKYEKHGTKEMVKRALFKAQELKQEGLALPCSLSGNSSGNVCIWHSDILPLHGCPQQP